MKVEGVTFIEQEVLKMTREEFIALHVDNLWIDRKRAARKKILTDTYNAIVGT